MNSGWILLVLTAITGFLIYKRMFAWTIIPLFLMLIVGGIAISMPFDTLNHYDLSREDDPLCWATYFRDEYNFEDGDFTENQYTQIYCAKRHADGNLYGSNVDANTIETPLDPNLDNEPTCESDSDCDVGEKCGNWSATWPSVYDNYKVCMADEEYVPEESSEDVNMPDLSFLEKIKEWLTGWFPWA